MRAADEDLSAQAGGDAERALREYNLLMDMLGVSVSKHRLDEDFTLVWANAHYYEFIGYPKAEYERLFRNSPRTYFEEDPEDFRILSQHVAEALAQGRSNYECMTRMFVKGGRKLWVKFAATFIDEYDEGYQLAYTTMTDVTDFIEAQETLGDQKRQLEQANSELERVAFVDPVTGGFNQTRFDLAARKVIDAAPAGHYAFVSLDLKKFKLLNEINGTECGDRVLRYVHDCLSARLEEGECVARIAADAFSLLVRADEPETLLARIDDMVQDANSFNRGVERPYYLSFTVGVYLVEDKGLSLTIVRDRANVARNSAKEAGDTRHYTCAFYSDVDRQNLLREQDVENRMRTALERGEFVAYLQPKQRLSDGAIAGAEALVRWIDPERGLVPPDEFVPFFERNGFIVEVDLCMFEQACALLAAWIDEGRQPVPISVNLSRVHLRETDFLAPYERIRERYGVPTELLEFELTETLVFEDPETFAGVIDAMHAHGYRCSLDDFGSGYSSLNVLKDLDVDTLKLDRAFFSQEGVADKRGWDVVESVVDLAKKLELETVAEGVEDAVQAQRLADMRCDLLQGYVFSRPVPVDEFERLLFGE
ncbi:putative bifunctional diguanylate cyclase/phosphodiesterase [Arabiibacter massiliensis]|uniref:putative bifunctional diguanylate cyclase/phosphodiesterase n=1 Tax=Arabiibacter massiliensis TaxID=1870985 RepID=UPI0009BC3806|nr:EAL domain-containing protein [Arabiibacter massiliensis]